MKKIIFLFAFISVSAAYAQNTIQLEDTNKVTTQSWRDTCFGLLNKTATWIPSGYLLDYSLVDSTFKGFNPNDTITESGLLYYSVW